MSPPFFTTALLGCRPHEENIIHVNVLRMFYEPMKRVPQGCCFGAVLVDLPLQHCMAVKECASRGADWGGPTSFKKPGLDWVFQRHFWVQPWPRGSPVQEPGDFISALSSQELQHALGWFAGDNQDLQVRTPLQGGGEAVPHVEEFKYLGVVFTSAFAILEPTSSSSFSQKVF